MQHLIVLVLVIGLFVLMAGAVLGFSYAMGAFMSTRGRASMASARNDPCSKCQADREWYEELPMWQRNVVIAWWLANRYQCTLRGCR